MGMVALALSLWLQQSKEPPFYQDIQKFVAADRKNPPAKGQILFVGSSSFTKWTDVQTYFPKHKILNRGFGGSTLLDVIRYQDQIIYPYKPSEIVIYCGENDVAAGDKPDAYVVYDRFKTLYQGIRKHMPRTPVVFVSLKPSPSRWALRWKMISVNGWIREQAMSDPGLTFVDVWEAMLDADRRPKTDIFLEDNLHMNAKGYKIWQKLIEPTLLLGRS
ncbi:MAG: G-D-S-L family lipolytic protein [Armatimonadetes bacterium]|nr:G-D-S-L family lipolytic protein [Armatimonadota bacterium]